MKNAIEEAREALKEIDRFKLVIDSAVRQDDPANAPQVMAALKAASRALAALSAEGDGWGPNEGNFPDIAPGDNPFKAEMLAPEVPIPSVNNVTTLTTPEGVTFSKYATLGPSVSGLSEVQDLAEQYKLAAEVAASAYSLSVELAKARTEMERATLYASDLARVLVRKHYPENTGWQPLPDLIGILTQIDNATAGLRRSPAPGIDWKRVAEVRARHEACEGLYAFSDQEVRRAHADRAFLLSLLPKEGET